jgi:hypothetical protein
LGALGRSRLGSEKRKERYGIGGEKRFARWILSFLIDGEGIIHSKAGGESNNIFENWNMPPYFFLDITQHSCIGIFFSFLQGC